MAAYTSSQTGNWNEAATWGGGGTPGAGDTATIDNGHTVSVTANVTVGDGVNAGITINGASAVNYGQVEVDDGVTLTVSGGDTSANAAILINQYGHFEPQPGSTIVIDCSADYQTCIVNNGHLWSTGTSSKEITFTTASADRDWSNAVVNETVASADRDIFDGDNDIFVGLLAHRPISNAAGTGLGSSGDTSFSPGACTPAGVMASEVSSYENISSHGDYYVDYSKGVFYFKCTSADPMSIVIAAYKYLTFYGSGILSQANTADSSCTFDYTKFEYMGSDDWSNEYLYGALMIRYKYHASDDEDRKMWVRDCTFQYCYRPLSLFNCIGTSNHQIPITYNTFDECWFVTGGSSSNRAGIDLGYSEYLFISYCIFDVIGQVCGGIRANHDIEFKQNSGRGSNCGTTIMNSYSVTVDGNTFQGFGKLLGSACISCEGNATGDNYFQDNIFSCDNRAISLGSYMVVRRNKFYKFYHHGLVANGDDGYIHDSRIWNNIFCNNNTHFAATYGGGLTTGYHKKQWIDDVTIANNTSDDGVRGINFNNQSVIASAILMTRTHIVNNIISNSQDGIYFPAEDANNETVMAPYQLDYNVDYNTGAGNTTNVVQATFTKGSNDYNTTGSKNLGGFCLFDPDPAYSMPVTNKTLALTVSGAAGTDLAYDVVWDGGGAVDLVTDQGTATGGTTSTLVKAGAGWGVNDYRCHYVKIHAGTGAGQTGMVKSNTADTLSIIAQDDTDVWTDAPDGTSVFVIYKAMIQPAGSDGKTVRLGIYLPDVNFPTLSASDTGIGFAGHGQTGDPDYDDLANGDLHIGSASSAFRNGVNMSTKFLFDYDEELRSFWSIGADDGKPTGGGKFSLGLHLDLL